MTISYGGEFPHSQMEKGADPHNQFNMAITRGNLYAMHFRYKTEL